MVRNTKSSSLPKRRSPGLPAMMTRRSAPPTPDKKYVTKYDQDYPRQAFIACSKMGANNEALALLFDVTTKTIETWLRYKKEFKLQVQSGRDIWDTGTVEVCYLKLATGYSYKEKVHRRVPIYEDKVGPKGGKIRELVGHELRLTSVTHKRVAPNVKACEGWLYNRDRERWRGLREALVTTTGELGVNVNHSHEVRITEEILNNLKPEQLKVLTAIAEETVKAAVIEGDECSKPLLQ